MKTPIVALIATAVSLSFVACTSVEERHEPTMRTTTTTEEQTIHHPVGSATTETRTIRSY